MKTVLIANRDLEEAVAVKEVISREFNVSTINSREEFTGNLNDVNLVLIDCNFTPDGGADFIAEILKMAYLPILALTPPDDAKYAAQALKAGAFNYIAKTSQHHEIINIVIGEAIHRFEEYEKMKQSSLDLKAKVSELEERLARQENEESGVQESERAPAGPINPAFSEILMRFKKGEINLPSPPQIKIQFDKLVGEGASIQEIAKLLKQDVFICSKLISISNSALYQGISENKTIDQAISRLGLNMTRKYVEVIFNHVLYATQKKKNLEIMERLWKHSISCGFASQYTCELIQVKQADEVFTMGLVHDIGKLILFQVFAEMDIDAADDAIDESHRRELAEILSNNHGIFGATLLKNWGFSELYQQVALFHDNPESADPISKELLIVHFANLLVKSMGYCLEEKASPKVEESLSARILQIDVAMIEQVKGRVQSSMDELRANL